MHNINKSDSNIDSFFKTSFEGSEITPSDKVWDAIEKELKKPAVKNNSSAKNKTIIKVLAGVTLLSSLVYISFERMNRQDEPSKIKSTTIQPDLKIQSLPAVSNEPKVNPDQNILIDVKKATKPAFKLNNTNNLNSISFPSTTIQQEAKTKDVAPSQVNVEPVKTAKEDIKITMPEFKQENKNDYNKELNDDKQHEINEEQRDINNNSLYNNGDTKGIEPVKHEMTDPKDNSHTGH
jgi:hypothetical protein